MSLEYKQFPNYVYPGSQKQAFLKLLQLVRPRFADISQKFPHSLFICNVAHEVVRDTGGRQSFSDEFQSWIELQLTSGSTFDHRITFDDWLDYWSCSDTCKSFVYRNTRRLEWLDYLITQLENENGNSQPTNS